jgi:hypothetical protein
VLAYTVKALGFILSTTHTNTHTHTNTKSESVGVALELGTVKGWNDLQENNAEANLS